MWTSDDFDFVEFMIRGREYDPRMYGIQTVVPPRSDAPYWEIEFTDGCILVTTDVVTLTVRRREG